MRREESKESTQDGEVSASKNWIWVQEGIRPRHWNKAILSLSEVQISVVIISQWRRVDESCVIGFTFQMQQTILLAVSAPTEVKWTSNAGNSLMLIKGDGGEEVLHWKAEIHRFPQIPVKFIIHRDWLSKSDILHTFWEQVKENNHCWMPLWISVREQELVQSQQRQLCASALSNKKYELQ